MSRLEVETKSDLRHVLAALGAGLVKAAGHPDLPSIFEQQVQQLLSMRAVRLREVPARYHARLVTPTRTSESIVVDVPTSSPQTQAVLEASFDPGRLLDEDDFATLTTAAHLGGLVLEAARGSLRLLCLDGSEARNWVIGLPPAGTLLLRCAVPRMPLVLAWSQAVVLAPGGRVRGYAQAPLVPTLVFVCDGQEHVITELPPRALQTEWDTRLGTCVQRWASVARSTASIPKPSPRPTTAARAPASTRAFAASAVAMLPPITSIFGKCFLTQVTRSNTPCA
mgnify:CR=1 FL=1